MTDKRHTTVAIEQTLSACTSATVDLPDGLAWEDIKDWYVKWDKLHYTTDNKTWHEIELYSDLNAIVDWKRPDAVYVLHGNYMYMLPEPNIILDQKP